MDTASHLLFGATLAGLAQFNPVVAQDPLLAHALLCGTLIGSHAPDFDACIRFKGFEHYVRYHRGITHSLPALIIWPILISLLLAFGFGLQKNWQILFAWVFLSVVIHVFLDLLNTYGVQCLLPFTKKWLHLDILNLFEPFLFLLHSVGLVLWIGFRGDPTFLFPWIYGISVAFIAFRALHHYYFLRQVKRELDVEGVYHVIPSFNWFYWRFIVETKHCFYTGEIVYNKVNVIDTYAKQLKNPVIIASMKTNGVRVFLEFAQRIHVSWRENHDGYEVCWNDVRFWYDRKLPFGVDVQLDQNLNVVSHQLGWRKKSWEPPFV